MDTYTTQWMLRLHSGHLADASVQKRTHNKCICLGEVHSLHYIKLIFRNVCLPVRTLAGLSLRQANL